MTESARAARVILACVRSGPTAIDHEQQNGVGLPHTQRALYLQLLGHIKLMFSFSSPPARDFSCHIELKLWGVSIIPPVAWDGTILLSF